MSNEFSLEKLKEQLSILKTLQKNFKSILGSARTAETARSIKNARIILSPDYIKSIIALLNSIELPILQPTKKSLFSFRDKKQVKFLTADDLEDQSNALVALIRQLENYIEVYDNFLYTATRFDAASIKHTLEQKLKTGTL